MIWMQVLTQLSFLCREHQALRLLWNSGACTVRGPRRLQLHPGWLQAQRWTLRSFLKLLVYWLGFGGWQKPLVFFSSAPLTGPHIIAIAEKRKSLFISWSHIPVQEQMGCILYYRIYWKERDSAAQPELCGMCENQVLRGLLFRRWERTDWACPHYSQVLVLSQHLWNELNYEK